MTATRAGTQGAPVKSREIWGQWAFTVPFAGRVLALQGMHPTVSAALEQHSTMFEHPWERAWETIAYGLELLFGDARATARQIRELHRPIRGTDDAGRPYRAWDREAWTWVHLSTYEATRFAARSIGVPLTRTDEVRLYDEWKAAGRLYGVQERDTPRRLAELDSYFADVIENRLGPTPTSTRLLAMVSRRLPPPPWMGIPEPLWALGRRPAGELAWTALVGSFPARLRERHRLRWTPFHRAQYAAMLTALRGANAALPERLRRIPAQAFIAAGRGAG